MFKAIIHSSLSQRLFVVAASLLLLVYGMLTLKQLPVDVFPDLNKPTATSKARLVTEKKRSNRNMMSSLVVLRVTESGLYCLPFLSPSQNSAYVREARSN